MILPDLAVVFFFAAIARVKRIILLLDVNDRGLKALSVEVVCYSLELITDMSQELRGFTGVGHSVES